MTRVLSIPLPDETYLRIERAAAASGQSVTEFAGAALATLAPDAANEVAQPEPTDRARLETASDVELLRAAAATLTDQQLARFQQLRDAQDERPLSIAERAEQLALLELHHDAMLERARALTILQARGYDLEPLLHAPSF